MLITSMLAAAAVASVDPALQQPAHHPLIQITRQTSPTPVGLTPQQIRHAYGVDQIANEGEGQTIGIVDELDDPYIESDLKVFSDTFKLPDCSVASGCLKIIYADGTKPRQATQGAMWETSLDIEWAHAIAPKARLLLVETSGILTQSLLAGVPIAVANGASVVNMSWGTLHEPAHEQQFDALYFADHDATYFNASGDAGYNLFGYPAASPLVVGVGATQLTLDGSDNIVSETAWPYSGGGESLYVGEPAYQRSAQSSGMRGVPDVSWDGSDQSGVAVYVQKLGQWHAIAGTSASSPPWTALTAIANSVRAEHGKKAIGTRFLDVIYQNPYAFNDIVDGSNGTCGPVCTAGPGYDFLTGLGSPMAPAVVSLLDAAP